MKETKWDRKKKDCRNCNHFYVCAYHKSFEIKDFIVNHLRTCMDEDNLKSQQKATKIIYNLLVSNCKYFNKSAYSNTYNLSKKIKSNWRQKKMNNEPLKNKIIAQPTDFTSLEPIVLFKDVKSAVEWLKVELKENMIYLHRGDKTYLFKQIDKAFEDVVKK